MRCAAPRVTLPAAVAVALFAHLVGPGPARAQQPAAPEQAPDTAAVDSTRARILERLGDLGRGPGIDSALLAQDTMRILRSERGRDGGPMRRSGGGAASWDSTSAALLEIGGYVPTSYTGERAIFDAQRRRLTLHGDSARKPRVHRQEMALTADSSIVYEEDTGRVRARGDALYEPEGGDPVESRTLVLDLGARRGTAMGARTEYNQGGARWIVHGDLPSVESEIVFGSSTTFTSCDLDEPHYHFETDRIKIHQNKVLVARPVRLYFADVPVAWLPFIAQGLGEGRSSGLLTPRFSVNDIVRTSRGFNRRVSNVGFYWAMSDYTDATVALDWFSGNFISVTSNLRYNWSRQFLNGDVNLRRFWQSDGGSELALNTRHSWEISERTRFSASANYASSTDFVRRNSFDPREVTQQIRSEGGLAHRFDWGSLNLGADRQQNLSDDRVQMTLPRVSLSVSPITFLQAPTGRARFYNNVTWNSNVSASRSLTDNADQPLDSTFVTSRADQVRTQARLSQSLTLGNLSLSQSLSYNADTRQGIPDFVLDPGAGGTAAEVTAARVAAGLAAQQQEATTRDLTEETLQWSTGVNYQQRLVGSTTITPSLRLSGQALRNDTLSVASGFVSSPTRLSFGASLKTDLYGFYPGFASFERIRHKASPTFSYDYSPEVTPNELQRQVFGSREIQARNVLTVGVNQTIEAKVAQDTASGGAAARDSAAADTAAGATGTPAGGTDDGLRRLETGRTVSILALQTSATTYDFVQADSAGEFLAGFTTTTLSNSVRSDFLRGLSLQLTHDLFDQEEPDPDAPAPRPRGAGRTFDPHLSSVNLSFSFGSSSALFQRLGLFSGGDEPDDEEPRARQGEPGPAGEDPFAPADGTDESAVVPGGLTGGGRTEDRDRGSGDVGTWNANVSLSLQRPRDEDRPGNQMLQANLRFRPTELWDVNWRTSYDVQAGEFNDHIIRLTRDLHRWQAHFDFRQTATGNWSFRFEVSLRDNRDLKFDYEQRSRLGPGR